MGTLMTNNSAETTRLLEQARAGDKEALNALLARHRPRLAMRDRLGKRTARAYTCSGGTGASCGSPRRWV